MTEKNLECEQTEIETIRNLTRRPRFYRVRDFLGFCATVLIMVGILALLVLSPVILGAAWYFLIVPEPISAAIIGVVCGVICDFVILMILN